MFSYSGAIIILYYSMCIDNRFEIVCLSPSTSCGKDSKYITVLLFRKTISSPIVVCFVRRVLCPLKIYCNKPLK